MKTSQNGKQTSDAPRRLTRLTRARFERRPQADRNSGQHVERALRWLPSVAVVLVLTTLVVYLTVGPGAQVLVIQTLPVEPAQDPHTTDPFSWQEDPIAGLSRGTYWNQWIVAQPQLTDPGQTAQLPARLPEPIDTAEPELPPLETTAETSAAPGPDSRPAESDATSDTPAQTEPSTPSLERDASGVIQEPLSPAAFKQVEETVYVKAFNANLRTLPRSDAERAGQVTMGDSLQRQGVGAYWSALLLTDGSTAYIYNDLISSQVIHKPAPTPQPTEPQPTVTQTTTTEPAATQPTQPAETAPQAPPAAEGTSGLTEAQKQEMVGLAQSMIGVRYTYAGSSASGVDCSGFTRYIYRQVLGITLPHKAAVQSTLGVAVKADAITTGDILCFDWSRNGVCDHVGLYIGQGQYIHASSSKGKVVLSTLRIGRDPIVSIRRIVP